MTYSILSLDGGGSRALFEVQALIEIYGKDIHGRELLTDFDLVAANSGGSVVLGCLLEDLTLEQILGFLKSQEKLRTIFSPTTRWYRFFNWKFLPHVFPKYSAGKKLPALEKQLPNTGGKCLNGITSKIVSKRSKKPVHILMTSFDYDRNRAVFFRSGETQRPGWGTGAPAEVTLAQAIHASANPPVLYFDGPAEIAGTRGTPTHRYWDGGLAGCNNPVLAAVTEAIGKQASIEDIIVLSLGSAVTALPDLPPGQPPSPLFSKPRRSAWLGDITNAAEAILDDPPDIATFLAHVMISTGNELRPHQENDVESRVVRMNPLFSPVKKSGEWSPPGDLTLDQLELLIGLNLDAIAKQEVDAVVHYAELWIKDKAPNQPIRANGKSLHPEIGQSNFTHALAVWKKLSYPFNGDKTDTRRAESSDS